MGLSEFFPTFGFFQLFVTKKSLRVEDHQYRTSKNLAFTFTAQNWQKLTKIDFFQNILEIWINTFNLPYQSSKSAYWLKSYAHFAIEKFLTGFLPWFVIETVTSLIWLFIKAVSSIDNIIELVIIWGTRTAKSISLVSDIFWYLSSYSWKMD